jgi:hypothetical protein
MNIYDNFFNNKLVHRINPDSKWYKWNSNGVNFFYANVNRLVSDQRREEFLVYLYKFNIKFDILVLVETFYDNEINVLNIPGYDSFHTIRDTHGGGVSIYTTHALAATKIYTTIERGGEFLVVNIKNLKLNVCGIYRPPNSSEKNFVEDFTTLTDKFSGKKLLLFGDFNLNLLNVSNVNNLYTTAMSANGLILLNKLEVEYATRIKNSISTLIDHSATNLIDHCHKLVLVDNSFSDHRHIILNVELSSSKFGIPNMINKTFVDHVAIKNDALKLLQVDDLNISCMQDEIQNIIAKNTKTSSKKIKPLTLKNPWFNKETLNSQRIKDRLYSLIKRYPLNARYHNYFIEASQKHANNILKAKQDYCTLRLNDTIDKPKEMWSFFDELMHGKSKNKQKVMSLEVGTCKTSDPKLVACEFNSYFTRVGKELAESIPDVATAPPRHKNVDVQLDFFEPTTKTEISEIIDGLNKDAASGHDGISIKLIKSLGDKFFSYLSREINASFDKGIFPNSLKIARVIPVYKNGDPNHCKNYRPISILSVLSKVYETVLKNRLEEHLFHNKLIHENQFGFMKKSNTTAASINFLRTVYDKLNKRNKNKQRVAAIFLDLQKAFDTVSHKLLLDKLLGMGVRGNFFEIVKSFLSNRKQYVVVDGQKSEALAIDFGIGQGTILGPLIFTIFINDLMSLELHSTSQFFADDGAFILSAPTHQILHQLMIQDMESINHWLIENKLSLNVNKTKFMLFFQSANLFDPVFDEIKFSNGIINRVDNFEYLGLVVDTELSFESHVSKVIKKIKPYVSILGRLKYYLPVSCLKMIYFAYIHSRIRYLLPAYGSCSRTHLEALELLHKKSLKHVFKLPYDHPTVDVYRKGIADLPTMIEHEMVLLLYRIKNNLIKTNFRIATRGETSGRTTRQSSNFDIIFTHLNYIKESFFSKGFELFNVLPAAIKSESSFIRFKRSSIKFLSDRSKI